MSHRSPFILVVFFACVVALGAPKEGGTDCSTCHEQGQKVAKSAHGGVACGICHEKHEQFPHPANIPKPACAQCHAGQSGDYAASAHGQAVKKGNGAAPGCAVCHGAVHEVLPTKTGEFHKNVPETCGMCHSEITEQYKASVHGKAVTRGLVDAPVCTSCHGEHSILSPKNDASTVSRGQIRETCGRCHADVRLSKRFGLPPDRITSFDASFHGLALKSGLQTVANCASCHGIHNILPSADPKSMTNAQNLPATCGKCHPGAGSRFALGRTHWVEGLSEPKPVQWVRSMYLLIIPLTIGYMILHHGGDFARKLWRLRIKPPAVLPGPTPVWGQEIRMYPLERLQHILLVISFAVLVWSGFALKYPGEWWAKPLVFHEEVYPMRGVVHRVAAVVMMALGLLHALTLIMSKPLREHWLELIPVLRDGREAVLMLLYNLGLINTRPAVSAHSYVAKLEYWAVAWGTFIMGLTGIMLWANNWTLRLVPREWLDAATAVHFYEAVLATLAIIVWHLYTVLLDPDVYPMDTAWLTGRSVRKPESGYQHEHK